MSYVDCRYHSDHCHVGKGQSRSFHKPHVFVFHLREIYRLTEGLQRERESLLKQLDLLRYAATAANTLTCS